MEGRLASRDVAYDAPSETDDEDAWQAPQYFLADNQSDPEQLVEAADFAQDSTARLQAALADLDDRSRDILERRWLIDDKSTLHELAAQYEVSAERIRQLEANAMKKLRTALLA
jgi:RNA polymerase sigma-32 factor